MKIQRIRGVALIVQNPKGEILILQEYQTKPHLGKYCGMFSIPMETSEPGEPDYHTVVRLVREELPGCDFLCGSVPLTHIGVYRIVPHVWVNLYSITTTDNRLPDSEKKEDEEVGNYQWIFPTKALNLWLRQGACEMISDFVDNKSGVLCRYCCDPQNK